MLEQNRRFDPSAPVGDYGTVPATTPSFWETHIETPVAGEVTVADEDTEPERYAGPSPVLVRQSSKQSWAQAKTLDALKDMGPKRLADWVAGLNEVAGFAKYRVA